MNYGLHDANYCIVEDGKLLVHNELERFTRIKHDGLAFEEFNNRLSNHLKDLGLLEYEYDNVYDVFFPENWFFDQYGQPIFTFSELAKGINLRYKNYGSVGHHTAHASSAYYNSNFEDAIVFTLDGGGFETSYNEGWTIWNLRYNCIFEGKNNKLNKISEGKNLPDIANIWGRILEVCDMTNVFGKNGDESGTLMSMAALGDPIKYQEYFRPYFSNQSYHLDVDLLKKEIQLDSKNKFHLAASLQRFTEDYMMHYVITNLDRVETKNVCFSGGVSLNCLSLGKIAKSLIDRGYNVFCDRAPNDSGLSLGVSHYHWHHILDNPLKKYPQNSYLGRTYSDWEILETLLEYKNISVEQDVDLSRIVDLLVGSKVISLFNGGSESGKRALGNRSIIADPRFAYTKDLINEKVKHRKNYRPFAPSVLREYVSEWYEFDIDSPYMSFAIPVKEEKRKLVPAIVHLDGTARLQTVTREENGYYYDLISLFHQKTGVPMILNTSFNNQEPIVETPKHAVDCFLGTKIDYLYFAQLKLLIQKI
jgi:carbamoyltransferase